MRLQLSFMLTAFLLGLTACQKQQVVTKVDPEAANPYKYAKKSAVCQVSPVTKQADGSLKATMSVRSDDGYCQFMLQQDNSKMPYPSFGVTNTPENGKVFLYNFNNHTYIRYTPTMAYAGSDKFLVKLIQSNGQVKTNLSVDVTVDATGVSIPKPIAQPVTSRSRSSVKRTTHRKSARTVKKKTTH